MKESPLPWYAAEAKAAPASTALMVTRGLRQERELGRQEQAREGARRSDGREVVAEKNVPVGDGSRNGHPRVGAGIVLLGAQTHVTRIA